jgi:hypothetical protein
LYTSGGNTADARKRAEHDARVARDKTLDGAERVGDKIDAAYDRTKAGIESRYKDAKGEFKKEYGKEKQEIGKQVEVPLTPSHKSGRSQPPQSQSGPQPQSGAHPDESLGCAFGVVDGDEFGGRWYSGFGGFGGLGLILGLR